MSLPFGVDGIAPRPPRARVDNQPPRKLPLEVECVPIACLEIGTAVDGGRVPEAGILEWTAMPPRQAWRLKWTPCLSFAKSFSERRVDGRGAPDACNFGVDCRAPAEASRLKWTPTPSAVWCLERTASGRRSRYGGLPFEVDPVALR